MFRVYKKTAMSFVEMLILLTIVGLLAVMYQKTFNYDTMMSKYAYRNVLEGMTGFASSVTNGYADEFNDNICHTVFSMLNTIGEENCVKSSIPDLPNFTTASGLRFFGLNENFSATPPDGGEPYLNVFVDADGVSGKNEEGKDILSFELLKNGRIRPNGKPITEGGVTSSAFGSGNPARDPGLFTVAAAYIPEGVTASADYVGMGNRLSYAEAQCLTGNPFPYRENSVIGNIQMCVENTNMRNEINVARSLGTPIDATNQKYLNYWKSIVDGSLCNNLYTAQNSVALGLAKANTAVLDSCKKCYKAAYRDKFCLTPEERADSTRCPNSVLEEKGHCATINYIE